MKSRRRVNSTVVPLRRIKENLLAMKIYILTLAAILVFSAIAFGQTDLPITGSIDDIRDLSKVYLVGGLNWRQGFDQILTNTQL